MEIGLSLGSNLGDRLQNLREARRRIGGIPGVSITEQSLVYETSPVGVNKWFEHLPFLNAVLVIETNLGPETIFAEVKEIERNAGRAGSADRNAPRPIDIDIIYAGDLSIDNGTLSVPHPRWAGRRFVVQPLSDVRPELRLPGEDMTVRNLLLTLPDDQKVVPCVETW